VEVESELRRGSEEKEKIARDLWEGESELSMALAWLWQLYLCIFSALFAQVLLSSSPSPSSISFASKFISNEALEEALRPLEEVCLSYSAEDKTQLLLCPTVGLLAHKTDFSASTIPSSAYAPQYEHYILDRDGSRRGPDQKVYRLSSGTSGAVESSSTSDIDSNGDNNSVDSNSNTCGLEVSYECCVSEDSESQLSRQTTIMIYNSSSVSSSAASSGLYSGSALDSRNTYIYNVATNGCTHKVTICTSTICTNPPTPTRTHTDPFPSNEDLQSYTATTRIMFYHAYNNYLARAYPQGELLPLSCAGRAFDLIKVPAVTLIDSLDTLVLLGDHKGFREGVDLLRGTFRRLFDFDVNVSVFEGTIRVLGGLLSAHLMAIDEDLAIYVSICILSPVLTHFTETFIHLEPRRIRQHTADPSHGLRRPFVARFSHPHRHSLWYCIRSNIYIYGTL
jgi:hypothetical protein